MEEGQGKNSVKERRDTFARLWTHKIKTILCPSVAPFRGEKCNANPVSVCCSYAVNSRADGETEEMLDDIQGKSMLQ